MPSRLHCHRKGLIANTGVVRYVVFALEDPFLTEIIHTEATKLGLKDYPANRVPVPSTKYPAPGEGVEAVLAEKVTAPRASPVRGRSGPRVYSGPAALVVYTSESNGRFEGMILAKRAHVSAEWKLEFDAAWRNHPLLLYPALQGPTDADKVMEVSLYMGSFAVLFLNGSQRIPCAIVPQSSLGRWPLKVPTSQEVKGLEAEILTFLRKSYTDLRRFIAKFALSCGGRSIGMTVGEYWDARGPAALTPAAPRLQSWGISSGRRAEERVIEHPKRCSICSSGPHCFNHVEGFREGHRHKSQENTA